MDFEGVDWNIFICTKEERVSIFFLRIELNAIVNLSCVTFYCFCHLSFNEEVRLESSPAAT